MRTTQLNSSEVSEAEVLEHLSSILQDRRFSSAERNASFLRYVVEKALAGKISEIKESVIAMEVYGRSSNYDPKSDSIVRVEATRLRQKLRSYYEEEGQAASIRFLIPSGTYVPRFERNGDDGTLQSETSMLTLPVAIAPAATRMKSFVLAASLSVLIALLSLPMAHGSRPVDATDADATAAWQEGISLMLQDPHSGYTESGPPKTLVRAIERLEYAVARSPRLAPAWATLSEAYDYAAGFVGRDPAGAARRAEAAARSAIALDDKLPSGHHMLGLALKDHRWDFTKAEAEYRRALALDPRNVYGVVELADLLWETGRVTAAEAEIRKARALLPALPPLAVKEAEIQLSLGRPDAALALAQSAIDLNRSYLRAYVEAGAAYEAKGDYSAAVKQYESVLKADPLERRALPAYGFLLARTGKTAHAREVALQLEKMNATVRNCAFQVAVVYAGLGEKDRALDWLERAWRTHQPHFPFAAVEYRFRSLHGNARFRSLLGRVGLKPVASPQSEAQ